MKRKVVEFDWQATLVDFILGPCPRRCIPQNCTDVVLIQVSLCGLHGVAANGIKEARQGNSAHPVWGHVLIWVFDGTILESLGQLSQGDWWDATWKTLAHRCVANSASVKVGASTAVWYSQNHQGLLALGTPAILIGGLDGKLGVPPAIN